MKKLMMIMLTVGMVLTATAQQGGNRPPKPESIEKRTERAQADLSLSDSQTAAWKEVLTKYDEGLKSAMENRDREKGEALREEMDTALNEILNDEQKLQFAESKKKRPKRKPKG